MAEGSTNINVPVPKGKDVVSFNPDDLSDKAYRYLLELGAKAYINSRMSKITIKELESEDTVKSEAMIRANENLEKLLDPKFEGSTKGAKASKVSGVVKTEAMRLARNIVKDEIKRSGGKISHYKASEITAAAKEYLEGEDGETLLQTARENLEARAKTAEKGATTVSAITKGLKVDPELVKKANAKKKDKPLSAKQAGLTTKSKKKGAEATA